MLSTFRIRDDSHRGGARLLRTFANSVRRQADSKPESDTKSDGNTGTQHHPVKIVAATTVRLRALIH